MRRWRVDAVLEGPESSSRVPPSLTQTYTAVRANLQLVSFEAMVGMP
jgi:hypothetical protein